jgi:hypothetical protein
MTSLHVLRRHLLGLEFAALFLASVIYGAAAGSQAAPAGPGQQPSASPYVGAETCGACHDDLFKNLQKTRHWNNVLKTKEGTEAHSCETSLGPGGNHDMT